MTTTESKHTPGPRMQLFAWLAEGTAWIARLDGGCIIAGGTIRGTCKGGREEIMANARLIAAAPETADERDRLGAVNAQLLEALQQIFEHAYDDDTPTDRICEDFDNMRDIARAAIAAAERRG